MEFVGPLGAEVLPLAEAKGVSMLAMEREWALSMVPGLNGYVAHCFVLPSHPASRLSVDARIVRLRDSLSTALARLPLLAGRWRGGEIALTNEGVRFTVVTARRPFEATKQRNLSDYPSSRDVASGRGPLATVKVTCFEDETLVVSFAASHSVCDSATTWQFIRAWTGDDAVFYTDRSGLPTVDDFEGTFAACFDDEPPRRGSTATILIKYGVAPVAERLWRWASVPLLGHPIAVPFSKDDLAALKAASPGCSTQVVVAALVVRALATLNDANTAKLQFAYDARPLLGLDPRLALGCGFVDFAVYLTDLQKPLPSEIRDQLDQCKMNAKTLFALNTAAFERGLGFETMFRLRDGNRPTGLDADIDIELAFNFQAKNPLPHFGHDRGLHATTCLCDNPYSVLPADDGGLVLHLAPNIMRPRLSSQRQVQAALAAIRNLLPQPDDPQSPNGTASASCAKPAASDHFHHHEMRPSSPRDADPRRR